MNTPALARHTTGLHGCNAPQVLVIERSPLRCWDFLISERCGHCGARLHVQGVIPEHVQYWADQEDDDPDDCTEAWQG